MPCQKSFEYVSQMYTSVGRLLLYVLRPQGEQDGQSICGPASVGLSHHHNIEGINFFYDPALFHVL